MATTSARTHGHHQKQQPQHDDPLRRMRGLDAKSALRASPRASTAATAMLLVPLGAALAGASVLALAATLATGLALVAPLLVVLSPVLVPSALAAALLASGLLASAALGVAGVSALAWAVGYVWRWRAGDGGGGGVTGMVVQPLLDDHGLTKQHGVEGTAAAFVAHRPGLPRDIDVA